MIAYSKQNAKKFHYVWTVNAVNKIYTYTNYNTTTYILCADVCNADVQSKLLT